MGGIQFATREVGPDADAAFRTAVDKARTLHGTAGYSGTIAEKSSFEIVKPNTSETPVECMRRIQRIAHHPTQATFGPAGCVDLGPVSGAPRAPHTFAFFGWASS